MHHQPYPHHPHHHQHLQQYPPMHPDMEHHISHHRSHSTHSRSSSGAFPHGFPGPHQDLPPGFQGHGPYHPPPAMVPQPDHPMAIESRHARSHSQSVSALNPQQSSGYRSPPPPPHMPINDPHAWPAPPSQHHPSSLAPPPEQPHLHQRAPHHPHPYHPPQPTSHSRSSSRSHTRTQSFSQPQFVPQHTIQSPPARHASPSVPVPAPRYVQDGYPERTDPVRFPVAAPQNAQQRAVVTDEEEENESETSSVRRARGQQGSTAEDEGADTSKCPDCGKLYKHATSLLKHRWEHSIYWKSATKFLLSKHQQVQMMEAAAVLLGIDESRDEDKDPIVSLFIKQRGNLATGVSTASASPPISTKSLSGSPPPSNERTLVMKQESGSMMSPPPSYHGRASNTATRHSVASTTSTASSLSSTPPSLAPDDESVAEVDEESIPPHFRQVQHVPQQAQQQPLQQQPTQQPHQMMMGVMDVGPKYAEPHFYAHDPRHPSYNHPPPHHQVPQQHSQAAYAPYYHDQH